jgi:hypothetical protein
MPLTIHSILVFTLIIISHSAAAQNIPEKKDSTNYHQNVEPDSIRGKMTRFLYRLFYAPDALENREIKESIKPKQKSYSGFNGKPIREIQIEILDPFRISNSETSGSLKRNFSKTGNKLHLKTRQNTIRNLLLFKQNQLFDSLLVKESERLLRSMDYISDVSFYVSESSEFNDSVDIFIRATDKWSFVPVLATSRELLRIEITEDNFLGLGHAFKNGLSYHKTTDHRAFKTSYDIPNVLNKYLAFSLQFGEDQYGNITKSVSMNRSFYSAYTRWAGGMNVAQHFFKDSIFENDSIQMLQSFKYNTQDIWAGYAYQLFKGNTEDIRSTSFISTFRFLRIRYLEKPLEMYDMQKLFANEDFYLVSFGISTRKYLRDKYIFEFGIPEDVPIGKVFSLTSGYQIKNNNERLYLQTQISIGNYYPWGYFNGNIQIGTFIRSAKAEQGTLKLGINYFTGIFDIGNWKVRQFVKAQTTFGLNRIVNEKLTLNEGFGIDGFHSSMLKGTKRILLTLQTQTYAPWNYIGFYFGPYISCSFGMLGDSENGFKSKNIYSSLSLGVLIKNVTLAISTLQISIGYYPNIPGVGNNIFKFNSIKTTDFGFQDYEIGKPETTVFR